MYEELIKLSSDKKVLEAEISLKKAEFEKTIALELAKLMDLTEEEARMRQSVLLDMKVKKLNSTAVGDKTIVRNVRTTRVINSPDLLAASIVYNAEKINGLNIDEQDMLDATSNYFTTETKVSDKDKVNEIIDKFYKVEGKLLSGVEEKTTEFLTIK